MTSTIYTDGSCIPNPGKGGYAFIILDGKFQIEVSGRGPSKTTNNQMELKAVIEAIKHCPTPEIKIFTDSQYVINCAQGLWKKKLNKNMWKVFDQISKNRKIKWNHVKAHSGDYYNEYVDFLAKKEAKREDSPRGGRKVVNPLHKIN